MCEIHKFSCRISSSILMTFIPRYYIVRIEFVTTMYRKARTSIEKEPNARKALTTTTYY